MLSGGVKLGNRLVTRRSWRVAACALVAGIGIIASAGGSVAANGWSVAASPGPLLKNPELSGVSCTSATSCTGVGWFVDSSGVEHTLVVRGSGSSWTSVASPSPPLAGGALVGVSCTSASSCFAVGSQPLSGVSYTTLVERWDGTRWTIVPSPNPPGVGVPYTWAALHGSWCASSTSCLAVGFYEIGGIARTLTERWDGTTWTIVSSPNPPGTNLPGIRNELSSLSCLSATNCYAVGFTQTSVSRTLVEHWNGTTWAIISSPNIANANVSTLSGVSCPSVQNCFAVGTYSVVNGRSHTLVEHWNGFTWAIVPSRTPVGALVSGLSSVSCMSPTSCVAVGSFSTSTNVQQTLVQQGDASSWSAVPSATPSLATASWLSGTSCLKSAPCVAVGSFIRAGLFHTLIEQS
jgi:hypothetical protein